MRLIRTKAAVAGLGLALSLAACGDAGDDGSAGVDVEVAENAGDEFEDGTRMKELADAGEVIIGVKFDQPGIGFKGATDDMPVGFDPELGKVLAASLGIAPEDITWTETISDNREPFLQSGEVDLVLASYSHHRRAPRGGRPGRALLHHRPAAAREVRQRHRQPRGRQGHRGLLGDRVDLAGEHRGRGRHAARLRHVLRVRRPGAERRRRRDDDRRRDPARATPRSTPTSSRSSWSPSRRSATASATRSTTRRCASGSSTRITAAQDDGTWEDAFAATLAASGVDTPEPPAMDECPAA